MSTNLVSHGAFPASGIDADDRVFMLLAEAFGGIAELRAELASLAGADPYELDRLRRELNLIEADACRLRHSALIPGESSGH